MVTRKRFFGWCHRKAFIFIWIISVSGGLIFAAERKVAAPLQRYMSRSLKHISAEQGRKYLAQAKIGTASQLGKSDILLITGTVDELVKAKAVLGLVDSEQKYVVKAILPASAYKNLPNNDSIANELGDIAIGTFNDPPKTAAKAKAIIDLHNGAVIAVAPSEQLGRIIAAIEGPQQGRPSAPAEPDLAGRAKQAPGAYQQSEPNQLSRPKPATKDPEANQLFGNLLNSLAKADRIAAQPRQVQTEPNAAGAVAAVPEPNIPSEPSADLQRPPKAPDEQQQAVTQPAAEKAAAKETAEEAKPKPKPEAKQEVAGKTSETAAPAAATSGQRYEPGPVPSGEEELELELPEKLNIVDLFDLVGKYLHLDYMYDPTKVKGEVSLRLQGPVKVKDLYPMLESVLKFKKLVMTRKGNLVTIRPDTEVWSGDPAWQPEEADVVHGDVIITRVFELEHMSTSSAEELLKGMDLGASITGIPETKTIIVAGYAYRMERIKRLLEMLDKPGKPKKFTFRQLTYTMAESLAPKIETLAEQLGTVSVSISISAPSQAPLKRRSGESSAAFRRRQEAARRSGARRRGAEPAEAGEPTVYLEADERTNRILMIGYDEQLAIVDKLINALDVEQQDLRTMRLYDMQHVDAEEVMTKLVDLGIISTGPTTPTRTPARRTPPAKGKQRTTTPGTAEEIVMEEPQVVVVESTNSLLVNATAEQHVQIATIIGYVDNQMREQEIPYKIYSLENQAPEDLAEVLNKLIQETIKDKAGKVEKVVKKTEEKIIIVPDKNTFSIVVYASKKNQEWIKNLIENLDKRRPQVLIDVTLVEVSKSDSFDYDLTAITSFPNLTDVSGLTSPIMAVPETSYNWVDRLTSSSRDHFADFGSNKGSGRGFYADRHINALLQLMQKKSYGRVLAKPKVLVNDNETGIIKTTDTIYIERISQTGRVSTATTGVADDFFNRSITFDPYDAGITLEITPHISEGDLLRLEITLTRSDFDIPEELTKPPDTTSSDITTVVTVPDGSTIILGGMLKLNQGKGGSKVPFIGDLPIVGGLFRSVHNSDIQKKLYVFVKAEILRPSDTLAGLPDLNRISLRDREAFEKSERQFQEYEDWPGVKPAPLDPLKVLDAR